jgi:hypothetical protein
MLSKAFIVAMMTVAGPGSLLVTGCASSEKPYALTGDKAVYGVNGAAPASPLSATERARYTDQKGRFHPEWIAQAR